LVSRPNVLEGQMTAAISPMDGLATGSTSQLRK
jgi:hypothetical protein